MGFTFSYSAFWVSSGLTRPLSEQAHDVWDTLWEEVEVRGTVLRESQLVHGIAAGRAGGQMGSKPDYQALKQVVDDKTHETSCFPCWLGVSQNVHRRSDVPKARRKRLLLSGVCACGGAGQK